MLFDLLSLASPLLSDNQLLKKMGLMGEQGFAQKQHSPNTN